MNYLICEFDNDYRTITRRFFKHFASDEEAQAWCKAENWAGHTYYAERLPA